MKNKQEVLDLTEDQGTFLENEAQDIQVNNKPKKATVVKCENLNIRIKPSLNAGIICVVSENTSLYVGEVKDGWIEVYDKPGLELEGYVMSDYVEVTE